MEYNPRESAEFIAKNSTHVSVNHEEVAKTTADLYRKLEQKKLRIISPIEHETFPKDLSEEDAINCLFLLDTLNFCFWSAHGQPKWNVKYNGTAYTGYFALCAAVARVYDNGIRIFDPHFYSKLTLEDLKDYLKGENDVQPALFNERLHCLHQVGKTLVEKYNGSFINCVKMANKSAESLLKLIVTEFPCFNDVSQYRGKTVSFHKRAQILVGDIWSLYYSKGISEFDDIDVITMFADYRIPQVLVSFGILKYSDELMKRLESNEILSNGSEEEVEIRGCSIHAVELLSESLKKYMMERTEYRCNSIMIDNYLWFYRRENADQLEQIPFHKVLSIFY